MDRLDDRARAAPCNNNNIPGAWYIVERGLGHDVRVYTSMRMKRHASVTPTLRVHHVVFLVTDTGAAKRFLSLIVESAVTRPGHVLHRR